MPCSSRRATRLCSVEALQEFQKVLKAKPRLAPVRYQLALAHLQAGSPQQAKTELREAVTIAPNFADAVLLLAEINIRAGAAQPAIEDLERLLTRQPKAAAPLVLPGSAYLAKREPVRATEVHRWLPDLAPKDPRAVHLVGVGLLAQGKRAEARKELEAALTLPQTAKELAPEDPHVFDTLGWILCRRGLHQRALTLLKDSAARLPANPMIQYHLGMVSAQLGDKDAARQALAIAAASATPFPGQDEARKALAALK